MKILQLNATNVMRLNAVEITPTGNTVVLTGKNTAGKTSVLRSIMAVLAGAKDRPADLLHRGAEKGEIVLTIGNTEPELIARLKVTPQGETLTVTAADGAKYQSPQSILDTLRGAIGFEPMTFIQLGKDADGRKKQAAMLQKLVGLNFTEMDAQAKALYDERTAVNREVKQAETVYGTMPSYDIVQTVETSVADLTERLQAVMAGNQSNEKARKIVSELAANGAQLADDIKTQAKELEELEKMVAAKSKQIEENQTALVSLRDTYTKAKDHAEELTDIDVNPLQAQIAVAEDVNRKVRANNSYKSWSLQMDERRAESDRLTKELEAIDASKRDQLKAAKMPVPNLSFTSEGVLLNDLPLESASGAEQLIVSLGIGSALSPRLRVLLFRDGALLDQDSRKIVEKFCADNDMQCWLETCHDEPGAVVISDGSVKDVA